MVKSLKQKRHLERLANLKKGKPSPLRGRKIPISPEKLEGFKKRISEINKKYWATHPNPKKGKNLSEETRKKISLSRIGLKLSQEHKDNISKGGYIRWSKVERVRISKVRSQDGRLIAWRKAVFERDNYTCQKCNKRGGNLEAHHKKPWADFPKLRYVIANGITYCYPCHKEVDPFRR